MLLNVYVAICLATIPIKECNRHTATDWMKVPETARGFSECAILGLGYAAEAHLTRPGEIIKIFCTSDNIPVNIDGIG